MVLVPRIIFEDSDFLIIDKPAGLIVHSDGRTKEPSVADWIIERYPQLKDVGEPWLSPQGETVLRPGLVQRLDRTTSGVMIVAKTTEMYTYLKREFKERSIDKQYRAYVYGHMETAEGRIVAEIMRSSPPPKKWYARVCEESDMRAAITEWKVLDRGRDAGGAYSYLDVRPQTGRTHQIRVHMASIGHPIVSDHLYAPGHKQLLGFTRPALHAYRISFTLLNREKATYVAPHHDFP